MSSFAESMIIPTLRTLDRGPFNGMPSTMQKVIILVHERIALL